MSSSNVVTLAEHRHTEVKASLHELAERGDRGEIKGAFWCLHVEKRSDNPRDARVSSHEWGISGTYRASPDLALKALPKMAQALHRYAARKSIDPLTATDVVGYGG